LSVVVPTRRYDAALAARLGRLAASHTVDEIIVVEPDGAGTAAPALRAGPCSSARPGVPLRLLRRRSRMVKLPTAVTTSAVRFTRNGILRQQLFNGSLLLRFLLGADPRALAACYERRRR
jgi:hypothetical protein